MNEWDGKERRKASMNSDERELLIRIDENVKFLRTDVEIVKQWSEKHEIEDLARNIATQKELSSIFRFQWMFAGAAVLIAILYSFSGIGSHISDLFLAKQ